MIPPVAAIRRLALPSWRSLLDNQRQNNIDLLRALAVVSVCIPHALAVYGGSFPFFGEYGGQFGIQLFFVISGYLISASCVSRPTGEYVLNRVFRIMPAYLLFYLGIGWLSGMFAGGNARHHPAELAANLLLLQHLFPSALLRFDALHVSWTLTVEVLWYVLAPLLLRRGPLSTRTLGVIVLLSSSWALLAKFGFLNGLYPGITDVDAGHSYLFLSNHFVAQLCFFAIGSWVYFNLARLRQLNPLSLLLWGLVLLLLRPYYWVFDPIFITGLALGLFLVAGLNSASIRSKLVFLVSETSYSIYLCHLPIMVFVRDRWHLEGPAGIAVSAAVTLLVSIASYLLVERPAVRLGRRLLQPRAAPSPA